MTEPTGHRAARLPTFDSLTLRTAEDANRQLAVCSWCRAVVVWCDIAEHAAWHGGPSLTAQLLRVVDVAAAWGVTAERVRQVLRSGEITPDFVAGRQAFWLSTPDRPRFESVRRRIS